MANNTQQTVRNYPGNYTVLARGAASTPESTYEVERMDRGVWTIRRFDDLDAQDACSTLADAKAAIARWHEGS